MKNRYIILKTIGQPSYDVFDTLVNDKVCGCITREKAEQVAEALNICHEYYDKPLESVRSISQF